MVALAVYRSAADGGDLASNLQRIGNNEYLSWEILFEGILLVPRGFSLQNAILGRPQALWFVILLLQYYLLFPLLLQLLKALKPLAFLAMITAISVGSSAWLLREAGDIDSLHGYIHTYWLPFRLIEFGAGMAMGYAIVMYPAQLRAAFSTWPSVVALVVAGLMMHTVGALLGPDNGYWITASYSLIVLGLSALMLAAIVPRPGTLLNSPPARLLAWMGVLSYAVLIVNETFRVLNDYFLFHGWRYTSGWWFFIFLNVPLTVLLAYPLARLLGLLPSATPRGQSTRSSEPVAVAAVS
jgi:peptidoglycan/LPS O-acetylase OafA/YrhL